MDIFNITETRWEILSELSKSDQNPKNLAKKLGYTLANTSHQLKFLEAMGYIERKKPMKGKEQRILYSLKREKILALNIGKNPVKKQLSPSYLDQLLFNLLNEKSAEYILAFLFSFHNESRKIEVLSIKDVYKEEIHLLVITQDVDLFREKNEYSITLNDVTKKVIIWSHTSEEIKEGLKRKDAYFEQTIKESRCLFEK